MTRKIITASNKKDKKISNERMIQDNPFLESQKMQERILKVSWDNR